MMAGILMEDYSQCKLFTCVTCIGVCLFADQEKLTSRSGMSSCKLEGKRKWKRSDAVA